MTKSAEAFRTISEVALELDVPKHVLRFWESKFPQVRPMKRGGGRRYYRPQDVELLRGIRHLLQAEGYTIKGVQKIFREQGIDHIKRLGQAPPPHPRQQGRTADSGETNIRSPSRGTGQPKARIAPPPSETSSPAEDDRPAPSPETVIRAAITELKNCRRILLGEPGSAPKKTKSPQAGA